MPITKTLIVAPAWVGDMLMSQPLYQILSEQQHQIDVIAPKTTLALASRMPQIHNTIESPFSHGELKLKQRYLFAKSLRHQYDTAVILPNSFKSALIPWWAKIKKRTGYLGEQRYLLLNDYRKLDKSKYPSLLERYAALGVPSTANLPTLTQPQLTVDKQNLQQCISKLHLTLDKPVLALCPGAEFGPAKRWPAQYYAKVAQHFIALGWQVWIFGTAKESESADVIQTQTNHACINLCAKTSLLDVIDLLSVCQLVASNDSGLMHIAAAVNVSLVAIYGSTSPSYTPPASNKATIVQMDYDCIPCFKRNCPLEGDKNLRCLKNLEPEKVIAALTSYCQ